MHSGVAAGWRSVWMKNGAIKYHWDPWPSVTQWNWSLVGYSHTWYYGSSRADHYSKQCEPNQLTSNWTRPKLNKRKLEQFKYNECQWFIFTQENVFPILEWSEHSLKLMYQIGFVPKVLNVILQTTNQSRNWGLGIPAAWDLDMSTYFYGLYNALLHVLRKLHQKIIYDTVYENRIGFFFVHFFAFWLHFNMYSSHYACIRNKAMNHTRW